MTKSQLDENVKSDIRCRNWNYRQKRMALIREGVLKIAPATSGFIHIYVNGFSCGCWNRKDNKNAEVKKLKESIVDTITYMRLGKN